MRRIPLAAVLLAGLSLCGSVGLAQDVDAPKPVKRPIGRFITVTSPIDDRMVGRLNNLALELQSQAIREDREALLVLEIEPGSSRFGQVSDVARFLTSADINKVRTVAWLPKSVEGTHVVLALACHDIVMHPDANAAEGDILAWCRDKMAGYKRPRGVTFIDEAEMPRTATGKILHRVLRQRFGGPSTS